MKNQHSIIAILLTTLCLVVEAAPPVMDIETDRA